MIGKIFSQQHSKYVCKISNHKKYTWSVVCELKLSDSRSCLTAAY